MCVHMAWWARWAGNHVQVGPAAGAREVLLGVGVNVLQVLHHRRIFRAHVAPHAVHVKRAPRSSGLKRHDLACGERSRSKILSAGGAKGCGSGCGWEGEKRTPVAVLDHDRRSAACGGCLLDEVVVQLHIQLPSYDTVGSESETYVMFWCIH